MSCQVGQFCCFTPACDEINRRGQPACGIDRARGRREELTTCRPGTTTDLRPGGAGVPHLQSERRAKSAPRPRLAAGGTWNGSASAPPRPSERLLQRRSRRAGQLLGQPGARMRHRRGAARAPRQLQRLERPRGVRPLAELSRRQPAMPGPNSASRLVCPPPADQRHAAGSRDPGTGRGPTRRWPTAPPAPTVPATPCVLAAAAAPTGMRRSTGAASRSRRSRMGRVRGVPTPVRLAAAPSMAAPITCVRMPPPPAARGTRSVRLARRVKRKSNLPSAVLTAQRRVRPRGAAIAGICGTCQVPPS